ncbi:MAG: peptidoglycan editing factor PgeF [Desulfotignum sp.]
MKSPPLPVKTFTRFSDCPNLVHGVFTRSGGVSRPPFDTLNVGFSTGDDPSAVRENRTRILSCLGLSRSVFLNQVHGKQILVLERKDKIDPDLFWSPDHLAHGTVLSADAVVTDLKQVVLVIQVADCQAVMLADPEKNVIANVHSGWRGSIENIIGRCVGVMVDRFGCDPKQMLAGISPSLGPCCAQFIHYRKEIPEPLWQYKLPDRDYFDFWRLSVDQLQEKGLDLQHITTMGECTRCRPDRFFSYRQAGKTGRFACAIGLT